MGTMNITIPDDTRNKLKKIAKDQCRSESNMIVWLIEEYSKEKKMN